MRTEPIRIGTRGSKLALWQARQVRSELNKAVPGLAVEIKIIKTQGDLILNKPLAKIGDKNLFTREIEQALFCGDIDMAVHSLKDLPTELPDGLILGAVLSRGERRDVLISRDGKSLAKMDNRDRIATSSLRRKAQLLHLNPHLNVTDIRGNVDTRIRKMEQGQCDALVMAGAGLIRLGYQERITEYLDPLQFLPAVSQGAVAVEVREDDIHISQLTDAITHPATWQETMAERAFLRTLEGGCQVPVGCFFREENRQFQLTGILSDPEGHKLIRRSAVCLPEEASEQAVALGLSILKEGGRAILERIRTAL
ncbi:MAG: hydroxymethylbilane synthase [Mangrovibacterium sp.]